MIKSLLIVNSFIFLLLALLHIHWALVGNWAARAVIPSNSNSRPLFKPTSSTTFLVAVFLIIFAVTDLAFLIPAFTYHTPMRYGVMIIGLLFFLRAIGDLKYIGFLKKYTRTPFAKRDSLFYSPLCLLISAIQFAAYWTK